MRFMQTESVLQTKNRSGPAKNRFSVALIRAITTLFSHVVTASQPCDRILTRCDKLEIEQYTWNGQKVVFITTRQFSIETC